MEIKDRIRAYLAEWVIYRYIVMVLGSLLLLAGVLLQLAWPIYKQHLQLEQADKKLEQKLELLEAFAAQHKDYAKTYEEELAQLEQLQEKLPTALERTAAINQLQACANQSGITIASSSSAKSGKAMAKLQVNGAEFRAKGSYRSILLFLERLEINSLGNIERLLLETKNDDEMQLQGKYFLYAQRKD